MCSINIHLLNAPAAEEESNIMSRGHPSHANVLRCHSLYHFTVSCLRNSADHVISDLLRVSIRNFAMTASPRRISLVEKFYVNRA